MAVESDGADVVLSCFAARYGQSGKRGGRAAVPLRSREPQAALAGLQHGKLQHRGLPAAPHHEGPAIVIRAIRPPSHWRRAFSSLDESSLELVATRADMDLISSVHSPHSFLCSCPGLFLCIPFPTQDSPTH